MVAGVSTSEGLVGVAPSGEEVDQLARSTKKAKMLEAIPHQVDMVVDDAQPTVVMETPLNQQGVLREQVENTKAPSAKGANLFPTATAMAMKRKIISYADACIGINGAAHEEESDHELRFEEEDDDIEMTEVEPTQNEPEEAKEGDLLCPTVKVSKAGIKVV